MKHTYLAGKGLREAVLRFIGSGDLYDRISDLRQKLAHSERVVDDLNQKLTHSEGVVDDVSQKLAHFQEMSSTDRLIELDYAIKPRARYGWEKPAEPRLAKLIASGDDRYATKLLSFLPMVETAAKILPRTEDPVQPHWINDWIPAFDAFSIYAQLVERNPPLYLEIGSGTSTKFARRAIVDHGLRTRIVSIDPQPRSEINAICDEIIRVPLEETSHEAFNVLTSEDMLFFDGSHRSFQNSDVTVFFTEILPILPKNLLIGIHDTLLPYDYPSDWSKLYYNEQYLLSCWLLAGDSLEIQMPVFYCSMRDELRQILDPLWTAPNLMEASSSGGAFWFTLTK